MFKSIPCVLQSDQSDCGAAALATVCVHHGRRVGLEKMRELAGTDREGTNLFGLKGAAEKLGFSARAIRTTPEGLTAVPLPAILPWITEDGLEHLVVLARIRGERVWISDPASGVRKVGMEELRERWTGAVMLLSPSRDLSRREGAGKVAPLARLLSLLLPHRIALTRALICAVLLTLLSLSSSLFIRYLVDSILTGDGRGLLAAVSVGMLLILVFRALFSALRSYFLADVGRKVDLGLVSQYARHVVAQPLRFFEMRRAGEIISRVSDAMSIREAVSGATLTIIVDATLVVVTVVAMFVFDPGLTVVACLVLPLFVLTVWVHQPFMKRASRRSMESYAALQAHLTEDIQSVETIKACNAEERRGAESDRRLVRMVQTTFSMAMINLSMGTISMLLTSAAGIVLLWVGAERAMDGAISVGGLMFFYSLLLNMLGPLERLASVNDEVQEALVAVDRVGEILDLEVEKLADPSQERFASLETGIRLEDLRFRYGAREDVLKGVDMEIPAGSTVAIVGESGSGKTTLLKLLQGFYAPTGGRALLDGLDMRDYSIASIRGRIGVVSQEPWIFDGTIRDNIAFGRPEATSAEIAGAVRAAGLQEFVDGLPDRYETKLGERGANLSGGQRQRIAIARALARNPEILIFDEATSHLDTRTESAVRDNLQGALAGKTVVVVAHRLSTIRHADRIFLLEDGRIVESGRHEELLALGGRYSELYSMQSADDEREPVVLVEGGER